MKTILFDLDGTLLPMDQDAFVKYYMGLLAQKMAPHGYEPEKLVEAVWKGVGAMVRNSGQQKNETVFWDCFAGTFGAQVRQDLPLFESFYENEFQQAQAATGFNPAAGRRWTGCATRGMSWSWRPTPSSPRWRPTAACAGPGSSRRIFP